MSINLTATTHSLEVETTTTAATHVVVSGRNKVAAGTETPISAEFAITTATDTPIFTAPAASEQKLADDIEICVTGSGTQTVRVQKDVGGTEFTMFLASLGSGERAHYTNDMGWRVFDSFGREKGIPVGYSLMQAPTLLTSGTTFTPSLGVTALLIELWGPGGAGGGAASNVANNASMGGGGSAGGYARKFIIGVPSSITYSIGAGGTGGAGAGPNGSAVTRFTVNGVNYDASLGLGGAATASATTAAGAAGGASVSGVNGDENIQSQSGQEGWRQTGTTTTINAVGGEGGRSTMGNGGQSRGTQGGGNAASGFGAGGGGACSLSGGAAQNGGSGAPGCIRVWQFTG